MTGMVHRFLCLLHKNVCYISSLKDGRPGRISLLDREVDREDNFTARLRCMISLKNVCYLSIYLSICLAICLFTHHLPQRYAHQFVVASCVLV